MNIVYASDNNFAEILGISMISLFENNKDCENITVFILDDGIDEINKKKILSIGEKYKRCIVFKTIPDLNELAGVEIHTDSRWSLSTFSRLFLEKIIPAEIKRVIYLDCDIVINGSLEELYNTDLGECFAGGVYDCISKGHRANIGLSPEDTYINAGMLLIELGKWRENKLCDKFIRFIGKFEGNIPYVDQGVINGTISKNIKPLDLKFNCYTAVFDFSYKDLIRYRKPTRFYSEQETEQAVKSPVIVHFTTSFLSLRPWVNGCRHPYANEWLKYKAMSPWADVPLRKDNRSLKKKLAVKVYRLLPKRIAVCAIGLLHAVVMPWKRKAMKRK